MGIARKKLYLAPISKYLTLQLGQQQKIHHGFQIQFHKLIKMEFPVPCTSFNHDCVGCLTNLCYFAEVTKGMTVCASQLDGLLYSSLTPGLEEMCHIYDTTTPTPVTSTPLVAGTKYDKVTPILLIILFVGFAANLCWKLWKKYHNRTGSGNVTSILWKRNRTTTRRNSMPQVPVMNIDNIIPPVSPLTLAIESPRRRGSRNNPFLDMIIPLHDIPRIDDDTRAVVPYNLINNDPDISLRRSMREKRKPKNIIMTFIGKIYRFR